MTYSIVARDAATGQLGVAAQSYAFALGSMVPWARAGIGAVATQSLTDPGYGPRCLDLMARGMSATEALEQVGAADPQREDRQVGVVDAAGSVASFTGSECIGEVSHASGDGYSAQANMMARPGVCEAMAEAFESAEGALSMRLVESLMAAQRAGGDARGQMSAALIVVEGARQRQPWEGVKVDVRVDHSSEPLVELARLVRVAQAYELAQLATAALSAGDVVCAMATIEEALVLAPGDRDLLVTRIAALVGLDRKEEAAVEVRNLVTAQPGWDGVLRAFVDQAWLPVIDEKQLELLLRVPPDDFS